MLNLDLTKHFLPDLSGIPDSFVFQAHGVSHMPQGDIHLLAALGPAQFLTWRTTSLFYAPVLPVKSLKRSHFKGCTFVQDAFSVLEAGAVIHSRELRV